MLVSEHLTRLIEEALEAATKDGALGPVNSPPPGIIRVEKPKQNSHGDLTCGVAMRLASGANMPPSAIANVLASYIRSGNLSNPLPANAISDLSVASGGFLNFKLGSAWLSAALVDIHKQGDDFGKNKSGNNHNIFIDFEPPLRSRNTFFGQGLANLFRWSGYRVSENPDALDSGSCDISINILSAQNDKKIKQLKELNRESAIIGSREREIILLQPIKLKRTKPFAGSDTGPTSTSIISTKMPILIDEEISMTLIDIAADVEILNTIDDDILRYCLVDAEPQDQTTLDPELSGQASRNNSAFYVRYVHARCCALMRQALDSRINIKARLLDPPLLSEAQFQDYLRQYKTDSDVFEDAFSINSEIFMHQKKLVMTLQSFPLEISQALVKRQPGRITRFARAVSDDMNKWYEVSRVITDNVAATRANLGLIMATRQVMVNALAVIGMSAPTIM